MAQWDAIVIGSGLGGLAAGAACARAGKRVLVLERLGNFGGAATTYRHDDLSIEASLHEIDGHDLLSETGIVHQLGVADKIQPIRTAEFQQVRSGLFSKPITVPHGLTGAEQALVEAFAPQREAIGVYFGLLRRLNDTLSTLEDLGARGPGAIAMLLFSGKLFEMLGETRRSVAQEMGRIFGDAEAVKLALAPHMLYLDDEPDELAFLPFAMVTTHYLEGGSYYLRGGSKTLSMALLSLIKQAGGEALRKRRVETILLDAEGRAAGVRHVGPNGEVAEETAAIVFGNAAPGALADMLPDGARRAFQHRYEAYRPSISLFNVALGLDRAPAEFGVEAYSTFIYPDWLTRLEQYAVSADVFGGEPGAALPLYCVCDYSRLDPQIGPGGQRLLTITGADRLWAWEGYDEDQDKDRRRRWIDAFAADLDRRFPGIGGSIRHAEMATARTMRNRLGSPHGEVYGFKPTNERMFGRPPSPRTPVDGLWIASAFTVSGGYAGAMHGGLMAARAALAESRRRARERRAQDVIYG